jgi:3-oxoacyl-[acyl-carrier protein] reductase
MGKLSGKVAMVTGAGRGIGLALVEQLAHEGANIVLNDLDPEPARLAAERVREIGAKAVVVPGDVTVSDFPARFIEAAMGSFGDVHIVVNNAGYVWNSAIERQTDEQWMAMQSVHLTAPFRLLRALQPIFKAAAAADRAAHRRVMRKVVNVTSVAGTSGTFGQASYSAAKAGVIGLTKTLAKEWGRFNVNVNAVAFGLIDTRLTEVSSDPCSIEVGGRELAVGFKPEFADRLKELIALGRAGTPVEGAGAIMLLCFPESDYISGQIIEAAGGLSN